MKQLPVIVLLDNIRSAYNVGSILRTADAVGVQMVTCAGYTPYPHIEDDPRPRFEAERTTALIAKTALGAENTIPCLHFNKTTDAITHFRGLGYQIVALEQADRSTDLFNFTPKFPLVLTLSREVEGHDQQLLGLMDEIVEIPMVGKKESLNVSVAAGVALYQLASKRPDR